MNNTKKKCENYKKLVQKWERQTNKQTNKTKRLNKSISEKYALIQCWTALFSFNSNYQLQLILNCDSLSFENKYQLIAKIIFNLYL